MIVEGIRVTFPLPAHQSSTPVYCSNEYTIIGDLLFATQTWSHTFAVLSESCSSIKTTVRLLRPCFNCILQLVVEVCGWHAIPSLPIAYLIGPCTEAELVCKDAVHQDARVHQQRPQVTLHHTRMPFPWQAETSKSLKSCAKRSDRRV